MKFMLDKSVPLDKIRASGSDEMVKVLVAGVNSHNLILTGDRRLLNCSID